MKIVGSTALEIADSVRALVKQGGLQPGDSLPPVRELADTLAVNRNTVAAAYQRLVQAGVAITQGRLGTSICRLSGPGEQEGVTKNTVLVDLADGNPNPKWLPDVVDLLTQQGVQPFLYGHDTVLPDLRLLAQKWCDKDCPGEWALDLTNGAVDAVERLAAAHLVPGDKVAVEDPGYLGTIGALRMAGMRTVGMAVDESGLRPDHLQAALENGARAVLLTPRAHNPTGHSLTEARAREIRQILAAYPAVFVIVDDHYWLLAESDYYSVIPSSTQRWALIRSVSKGFGPDLRVAFVACDVETGERLGTRLAPGVNWVSHILQTIVAAGLMEPRTRELLDSARQDYARRLGALRDALLAQGFAMPANVSGLNLWIPLLRDAKDVAYELAKRGWLVRLGSAFDVQGTSQAIRITIAKLEPAMAKKFAEDLRACTA